MTCPPYMPLYIADYLADTRRLTTIQHGAYLLLIMDYWRNGKLPTDDKSLAQIAGMGMKEWLRHREKLIVFFSPGWTHKRIDAELQNSLRKHSLRVLAGTHGGHAKSLKTKKAEPSNAIVLPEQNPSNALASSSLSESEELANANSKRAKRATPREILRAGGLSEETASGVLAHRQALRAPLMPLGAMRLVKAFNATGDPEAAALMMIDRAWKGFKPEWYENEKDKFNGSGRPRSVQEAARNLQAQVRNLFDEERPKPVLVVDRSG